MNEIWAKAADLSEQLAFDNATLLLLGFSFLVIAIIFGVSLLILLTSRQIGHESSGPMAQRPQHSVWTGWQFNR